MQPATLWGSAGECAFLGAAAPRVTAPLALPLGRGAARRWLCGACRTAGIKELLSGKQLGEDQKQVLERVKEYYGEVSENHSHSRSSTCPPPLHPSSGLGSRSAR